MTQTFKGYYSIIQYCPDLGRFEAANVGVLLFCPDLGFLKARMAENNARIRKFFGTKGHDWKRISLIKQTLADRLTVEQPGIRSLDDLQKFIATRANALQLTSPQSMKVLNPESDLQELFQRIIDAPARRKSGTELRRVVAEKFSAAGVQHKVATNLRVEIQVLAQEIEIPFGFQNGRFHLINPIRLGHSSPEQTLRTACKYAVEGRSLFEHPDRRLGPLQLDVVADFAAADPASRDLVRRVFDEHQVRLFATDDLPMLVEEIRLTGHELPHEQTDLSSPPSA